MRGCADCIAKEQRIEHLERECRELNEARVIVKLLERDLQKLARKYLYRKKEPIRLPFKSLIELLWLTSQKQGYERGFKTATTKLLTPNMGALIASALPHLKTRLQDAFPIPVLVKLNNEMSLMKYRAIALRGNAKQTRGTTPDEAYRNLKDGIAASIACRPEVLVHLNPTDLVKEYQTATPIIKDEISGFRVDVRISPEVKV